MPAPRLRRALFGAIASPSGSSQTSSACRGRRRTSEAGKWEHVISDDVEKALLRTLGNPTTCPHGNPIPGSSYEEPDTVALSDLTVGAEFTVSRIPEELEFTPGLLDFLEDSRVLPGQAGEVLALSPDGTTTVSIDGTAVGLGAFASDRILVTV